MGEPRSLEEEAEDGGDDDGGGDEGGAFAAGGLAGDVLGLEGDASVAATVARGVLGESTTLDTASFSIVEGVDGEVIGAVSFFGSTSLNRLARFTLTGDLSGDDSF